MAKELARQIFDDLTNAGFIPDRLEALATSPVEHERAMKVIDESIQKFNESCSAESDLDWSGLTDLAKMRFNDSEEEYLVHCRKWNSDPAYRENNPYLA